MVSSTKNFEIEINGLRGVAVILVILFHYQIYPFSGGFIGVDIFFVISGYLIGKIINNNTFNFKNYKDFLLNRIKRIFPGLLGLLIFTFILSSLLLAPNHFKDFVESIIYNLLIIPNYFFWSQSNYFDISSYYKPLLHTWSLGVEYHFYLLWPIFIWVLSSLIKKNYLKNVALVLLIILIIFITEYLKRFAPIFEYKFLYGKYVNDTIFFLSPFRLFEFILGYLLTINSFRLKKNFFNECIFLIGILFIIFASINFDQNTFFPGISALIPTLGAFFLIFSKKSIFFGYLLRNRIINFFGNISFSLYLYHWPIFIFYKYYKFKELIFLEKFLCLVISVFLAYLSFVFIEKNYLKMKIFIFEKKLIYFTSLIIILSFSVLLTKGWEFRLKDFEKNIYLDKDNTYGGNCKILSDPKKNDDCIFGNKNKIDFLLIGDSHGKALYNGIELFSKRNNYNFLTYEDMCKVYPNLSSSIKNCKIEISPPEIIILGKKFYNYQFKNKNLETVAENYVNKILEIKQNDLFKNVNKIIIFGQVPEFYSSFGDLLSCYTRPFYINKKVCDEYYNYAVFDELDDIFKINQGLDQKRALNKYLKKYFENNSSQDLKLHFFDPFEKICELKRCDQVINGKMIYSDSTHLSIFGSKYLVGKFENDLLKVIKN